MLGANWQHSQVEIEHQGFEMFAGERSQPSAGLDGDLDKGNRAHEAHGIGVFEEALDGPLFAQWLTERLLPALGPGHVLVLDNLSVHKTAAARAAVEAAGCTLCFLPAYSPDFNPIELIFSQLKAHLRGAAARTFDRLVDAIGVAFDQITAADIQACFRHCGYALAAPH